MTAPFASVLFDCDSTLSTIEGIEELAVTHRDEVSALTHAVMDGRVPLQDAYGRRLALIRPTRADLDRLARQYVESLVDDARAVVAGLQALGVSVRIISGGLRPAVLAVAHALGVAPRDVAAVDIRFDDAGAYAGFDTTSPLARAGGKRDLIVAWQGLERPAMLVGDGATDLEARDAVDCFVAYAGVAARPAVVAGADVVVRSRSLAPVFALALGEQRPNDPHFNDLYDRGVRLLHGAVSAPARPSPSRSPS